MVCFEDAQLGKLTTCVLPLPPRGMSTTDILPFGGSAPGIKRSIPVKKGSALNKGIGAERLLTLSAYLSYTNIPITILVIGHPAAVTTLTALSVRMSLLARSWLRC